MQKVYDIKFLSNKDFDNMPIMDRLGEDVSDSWGIYNPHTGQVRIRDTGFWEANKYLLEHELEHAVEEHATDEGPNGLRHKKGKKFFKQILMPLFTGFNGETGGFSPLGILGDTSKKEEPQQPEQPQFASFGGLGMGLPGGDVNTPTFGSSFNPTGGQQESQGSLNQGLNSQTVNPLDPYSQYGRSSGRLSF